MTRRYDIAVMGGGLIGLMTALELQKAGFKVAVIDKQSVGQASSYAGGGILSCLTPWTESPDFLKLCSKSQQLYPALNKELKETTSVDPEYIRSGFLIMNPQHTNEYKSWLATTNDSYEMFDQQLVIEKTGINTNVEDALYLKDVAQVRNPCLVQALKQSLLLNGVEIIEHAEIKKLAITENKLESIQSDSETVQAELFILAAGAWSGLPNFQIGLDITPVHGQMLCYQTAKPILETIVLEQGHYVIPRKDNVLLVGSTLEEKGFDTSTSESARQQLHDFASALLPSLKGISPIKQWAGLRPKSADSLPYICRHDEIENLYLNTGHFRNGILAAPASARLLTDIILERDSFMPKEIFNINR